MADAEDLLIKLSFRGEDPAEIEALAQKSGDELRDAMAAQYGKLKAAYVGYKQAETDEARKFIAEQIKLEEDKGKTIERILKATESAQKEHYSVLLANIAHMKEAAEGMHMAFEAISGAFERFKGFAEDSIRMTQIYDSLKGSIEGMRDATHGAVTDVDLITTRNRAMLKELVLTDEQFANVSKVAMTYAHALGVPVKEALDSVTDGLATGRVKMLQHAGVMVDAKAAQEAFAKSIGTTSEYLDEAQKKYAVQEEALKKIAEKAKEAGEETENMATHLESGFTAATNSWNELLVAFGRSKVINDVLTTAAELTREWVKLLTQLDNYLHPTDSEISKRFGANGQALVGMMHEKGFTRGDTNEQQAADDFLSKLSEDMKTYRDMHTVHKGPKAKSTAAADAKAKKDREFLDQILFGTSGGAAGMHHFSGGDEGLDTLMTGATSGDSAAWEKQQEDARKQLEKMIAGLVATGESRLRANGIAKGGLMARVMFGDPIDANGDPSEDFANKVRSTSDIALQMMGDLNQAAKEMSQAAGASIEAMIGGASAASLHKMVHDQLLALGTKYQVRALEFAAEGAGFLVFGDAPQAAAAFAAAGLWEGAAIAAGVGARAIGTGQSASSSRASTSSPPINRGSGLPSSSSGGSNSGNGGSQTIIVNQTVLPGGEAEAGLRVRQALQADYSKTGLRAYPGG